MLTVSISEIKRFWEDPTVWAIEYIKGRTTRSEAVPLVAGNYWHLFMEDLLNGLDRSEAKRRLTERFTLRYEQALSDGWTSWATKLEKEQRILEAAADVWQDWFPVTTLAVEKALALDYTDDEGVPIRIVGRPDRVIRFDNGGLGHYQHRTIASGKNITLYIDTFHRNPHEGVYWKMLEQEYGEQPFGTMLSLVRKLKDTTIRDNPQAALQQHPVPITQAQATLTLDNVKRSIQAMKMMRDGRLPTWNNPDNDLGRYGSSLSPYYPVLSTGDYSLLDDDERFMDTRDRYAELAEVDI